MRSLAYSRNRRPLLILLIVAVVAFLVVYSLLWRGAPYLDVDSPDYLIAARDLQDWHLDQLQARTAGYPLLLVLTNSTEAPARVLYYVQLGFHLVSVLLLAVLLNRMGVRLGLLAALIALAVLPPYVEAAAKVMTENVTQFLLVVGIVGLSLWLMGHSVVWLVVSGILLAYAGITRPTYQLLSPVIAVALLYFAFVGGRSRLRRRVLVSCAALIVPFLLIVGGYAAYNYTQFGFFGTTPLLGFNLSTKTASYVERLPDEYADVREILVKHRDAFLIESGTSHTGQLYIWKAIPELEQATGLDYAELSRYMQSLNLLLIRRAPLNYLLEVARSFVNYWFPSVFLSNLHSPLLQIVWSTMRFAVMLLFFGACAALGFLLLVRLFARRAWRVLQPGDPGDLRLVILSLFGLVIFYTMVVSTAVDTGNPRHRTPTDLAILVVCLLVLDLLLNLRRRLLDLIGTGAVERGAIRS